MSRETIHNFFNFKYPLIELEEFSRCGEAGQFCTEIYFILVLKEMETEIQRRNDRNITTKDIGNKVFTHYKEHLKKFQEVKFIHYL